MSPRRRSRLGRGRHARRKNHIPMPDELDDCPICLELQQDRVPWATLDSQGRMVRIDQPPPPFCASIRVKVLLEKGPPLEVSLPEGATCRDLLSVMGPFFGAIEPAGLTRVGRAVLLDELLDEGAVLRLSRPPTASAAR